MSELKQPKLLISEFPASFDCLVHGFISRFVPTQVFYPSSLTSCIQPRLHTQRSSKLLNRGAEGAMSTAWPLSLVSFGPPKSPGCSSTAGGNAWSCGYAAMRAVPSHPRGLGVVSALPARFRLWGLANAA